jgi:hypothetical protein
MVCSCAPPQELTSIAKNYKLWSEHLISCMVSDKNKCCITYNAGNSGKPIIRRVHVVMGGTREELVLQAYFATKQQMCDEVAILMTIGYVVKVANLVCREQTTWDMPRL